jgi:hypothetical protein
MEHTMAWRHILATGMLALAAAVANPALAGEQPTPARASSDVLATPPAAGGFLSDAELADAEHSGRGPAAVALTDQDLTAVSTGNTITAGTVGSGNISMSDAALSDFNGIGNFTFNTGHNNTLQSSMSVTVIVTP